MTHRSEANEHDATIERLRRMPELAPPEGLRSSIMAALQPKTPGLWRRVRRFLFEPRTITFVPVKWAPVLVGLFVLAFLPRLTSMGTSPQLVAEAPPAAQATLVFTFERPDAQQVALIGSFNRWTPDKRVRTERQGNIWIFHLDVEPGRYEYAFLVDGRQIVPDPRAAFQRDNGFGPPNSIVYATANGRQAI
jgi:hypothetical protein